ncbi:hypothetical protein L13192_08538 [Pyrenophora tritici-repentis]|nr:hypothetical protein L13192_08538 [Pyrenophora tritici-repentis]
MPVKVESTGTLVDDTKHHSGQQKTFPLVDDRIEWEELVQ